MEHSIRVERLFKLGDYQNIKIDVETTGITDEQWNSEQFMNSIRYDLSAEIITMFSHEQLTEKSSKEDSIPELLDKLYLRALELRHTNKER